MPKEYWGNAWGEGSFIYKTSALKATHGNFPQALCFSLAMSSEVQQGKWMLHLDFCLIVYWAISAFQFCWLDLFQFLFLALLYTVDFGFLCLLNFGHEAFFGFQLKTILLFSWNIENLSAICCIKCFRCFSVSAQQSRKNLSGKVPASKISTSSLM